MTSALQAYSQRNRPWPGQILLLLLLLAILATATAKPTPQPDKSLALSPTTAEAPALAERAGQPSAGSDCTGSEGQWYCMTNSWQRCASGRWSVVMQCAAGTQCAPSGATFDFHVQATGGSGAYTGVAVSWAEGRRRRRWWLSVVAAAVAAL